MIRLQKVMADRGVASRRRAEEMITEGRVRVDGELVTTLGTRVAENARIQVDGRPVAGPSAHRYVLMNKPVGIVSTASDERGRRTVVDHIGAQERLFPVGRLDTDSEGLLLLTNDGTWAEHVLHPRYGHEREYDVAVEGDLTDEALERLQRGIPLEEGVARAVRITVRSRSRGRSRITVVLRTGWKRQVRRMCLAVGLKVARLVRVRMGPLELGRLRPGEFRDLTKREIDALTAPLPARSTRVPPEKPQAIAPRVMRDDRATGAAPRVPRRDPLRALAPRVARRTPPMRARVGPVESARAGVPRVTRRATMPSAASRWEGSSRARAERPREGVRGAAPRVTRRAGSSRAREEGPRRQRFGERAVEAGRPTRERGPRAAAGPAARFNTRGIARRAVAPRAPAREGLPTRRGGVSRVERVSAPRRAQRGARA